MASDGRNINVTRFLQASECNRTKVLRIKHSDSSRFPASAMGKKSGTDLRASAAHPIVTL
jgi:hypothetical protein